MTSRVILDWNGNEIAILIILSSTAIVATKILSEKKKTYRVKVLGSDHFGDA